MNELHDEAHHEVIEAEQRDKWSPSEPSSFSIIAMKAKILELIAQGNDNWKMIPCYWMKNEAINFHSTLSIKQMNF